MLTLFAQDTEQVLLAPDHRLKLLVGDFELSSHRLLLPDLGWWLTRLRLLDLLVARRRPLSRNSAWIVRWTCGQLLCKVVRHFLVGVRIVGVLILLLVLLLGILLVHDHVGVLNEEVVLRDLLGAIVLPTVKLTEGSLLAG